MSNQSGAGQLRANNRGINMIFIHSDLDDMGLTMAEFRAFAHLSRRAGTGEAFPGIDSIASVCRMSKQTAIDAVRGLECRRMINCTRVSGKSNRYTINNDPDIWVNPQSSPNERTVKSTPKEGTGESKRENATGPNERTKGDPSKEIHQGDPSPEVLEVDSKSDPSPEGFKFADWFKTLIPEDTRLATGYRKQWAIIYDCMLRIDKRTKEQVKEVCVWARSDSFWKPNFLSPAKLRNRNKDKIMYFDVFAARMKAPVRRGAETAQDVRDRKRASEYEGSARANLRIINPEDL